MKDNNLIQLKVEGLSQSPQEKKWFKSAKNPPKYHLVLSKTDEPNHRLGIGIGETEAQAIAIVLEGLESPRPTIYDLFIEAGKEFDFRLDSVVIDNITKEAYFDATAHFFSAKKTKDFKLRPAEAISIAIRCNAPIYILKDYFDKYAVKV